MFGKAKRFNYPKSEVPMDKKCPTCDIRHSRSEASFKKNESKCNRKVSSWLSKTSSTKASNIVGPRDIVVIHRDSSDNIPTASSCLSINTSGTFQRTSPIDFISSNMSTSSPVKENSTSGSCDEPSTAVVTDSSSPNIPKTDQTWALLNSSGFSGNLRPLRATISIADKKITTAEHVKRINTVTKVHHKNMKQVVDDLASFQQANALLRERVTALQDISNTFFQDLQRTKQRLIEAREQHAREISNLGNRAEDAKLQHAADLRQLHAKYEAHINQLSAILLMKNTQVQCSQLTVDKIAEFGQLVDAKIDRFEKTLEEFRENNVDRDEMNVMFKDLGSQLKESLEDLFLTYNNGNVNASACPRRRKGGRGERRFRKGFRDLTRNLFCRFF